MPISRQRAAFGAIFTLGFFALLRPSEITCSGRQLHYIRFGNVMLHGNTLSVTVPPSKTSVDPFETQLVRRPDSTHAPSRLSQNVCMCVGLDGHRMRCSSVMTAAP